MEAATDLRSNLDKAIAEALKTARLQQLRSSFTDVRFWPIADIPNRTAHVRFRGKADIALFHCHAGESESGGNVRRWTRAWLSQLKWPYLRLEHPDNVLLIYHRPCCDGHHQKNEMALYVSIGRCAGAAAAPQTQAMKRFNPRNFYPA